MNGSFSTGDDLVGDFKFALSEAAMRIQAAAVRLRNFISDNMPVSGIVIGVAGVSALAYVLYTKDMLPDLKLPRLPTLRLPKFPTLRI